MATPITPTPVLEGEDANRFLRKLQEDLKTPAHPVPTPRIEKARELVRQVAARYNSQEGRMERRP